MNTTAHLPTRRQMHLGRARLRFMPFIIALVFFLSLTSSPVWANPYIPNVARAKIDAVDTLESPFVVFWATVLDEDSRPIGPDDIENIYVIGDNELLGTIEASNLTNIRASDVPIDIAISMPMSKRFTEEELEEMKKQISKTLEITRDIDRVACFFDDGRAINVAPLGPAKAAAKLLKKVKPIGQPGFLYSSIEKALAELTDETKWRPSKKVLILVTDAFDSYIYLKEDVRREIQRFARIARESGVRIYVVMYNPLIKSLIPIFEGLSRKTGGTYREVDLPADLTREINHAVGEVFGELQMRFELPHAREGQQYTFQLKIKTFDTNIETLPSAEIKIPPIQTNWRRIGIIAAIVVGILLLILIIFLIIRKIKKRRAKKRAQAEEELMQDRIQKGEVCPKCRRVQMPEWEQCMFCAKEAAEKIEAMKREDLAKKSLDVDKNLSGAGIAAAAAAAAAATKTCPTCKRVMMPSWHECLYCKAGIGVAAAVPKAGVVGAGSGAKQTTDGERVCPTCKRAMKAHWEECLYCAAQHYKEVDRRPVEAVVEQLPENMCPVCRRMMKTHWTECLYCAAQKDA